MTFFDTLACHSRPIAISCGDWDHVRQHATGGQYDHRSMVIPAYNANYGVLTYYVMVDHSRYYRYDGPMTLSLYEVLEQVEILLIESILDDIKSYLLSVGVDLHPSVTIPLLGEIGRCYDGSCFDWKQSRESWIFDQVVKMYAPHSDLTA